jgi:hypothetical protein
MVSPLSIYVMSVEVAGLSYPYKPFNVYHHHNDLCNLHLQPFASVDRTIAHNAPPALPTSVTARDFGVETYCIKNALNPPARHPPAP